LSSRALEGFFRRLWWTPRPSGLARLLTPLSLLYGGLQGRQRARAAAASRLPVPVLVVGNLVVGGAGKTPTVLAVVQALQLRGHRPGIVSRGHGRDGDGVREVGPQSTPAEVGDEPLLLARRSGVPVVVGRQRVQAARALLEAHPELDVIVADDGLQHHALPRRAELVVFDERGAGNGLLLPAGPLREPLPASHTAGAGGRWLVYTSGRASTPLSGALAQRRLTQAWPLAAWHQGDARQALSLAALRGRPLLAAAGLAAPEKFFRMLGEAGLDISTLPLPDHHDFATLPWPAHGPDVLVTEKDAVKLDPARCAGRPVWVLPLDLSLPESLLDALHARLFGSPPAPSPATPAVPP
jgi:tetraacyldisaccharide 4'-kinase